MHRAKPNMEACGVGLAIASTFSVLTLLTDTIGFASDQRLRKHCYWQ